MKVSISCSSTRHNQNGHPDFTKMTPKRGVRVSKRMIEELDLGFSKRDLRFYYGIHWLRAIWNISSEEWGIRYSMPSCHLWDNHGWLTGFLLAYKIWLIPDKDKFQIEKVFAYAIMPIGKKKSQVHADKKWIPKSCCSTVWGFFFSFIVAKYPLG